VAQRPAPGTPSAAAKQQGLGLRWLPRGAAQVASECADRPDGGRCRPGKAPKSRGLRTAGRARGLDSKRRRTPAPLSWSSALRGRERLTSSRQLRVAAAIGLPRQRRPLACSGQPAQREVRQRPPRRRSQGAQQYDRRVSRTMSSSSSNAGAGTASLFRPAITSSPVKYRMASAGGF
jgi:hypothetical protein